ncbi:MAG TPA: prepilin peptidase [Pyrinomonadaceae bacterium]|nr:prepilin peptidase [Pyrinomonadaceae bacterium]
MTIFLRQSLETLAEVPDLIGYIFAFLFGAAIGSFLNVVIHRVPNEQSIVFPNSACPKCGEKIRAYDNIPILSWLLLQGKCRNCKAAISARYPAVELLTAVIYVVVYWQIGLDPLLPVALIFVSAIVALIFIDAEHMILPNVITYPLLIFAILVRILYPLLFEGKYFSDLNVWPLSLASGWPAWALSLAGAFLGALVGGGFLWIVGEAWKRLRGVDAMGLGDVKMMAAVGALLGWRLTLLSIFLGAFSGALIGSVLVIRQKDRDLQMQIPFGIFLGIGTIVALLFGERLISWYIGTFIP